MGGTGQRGLAGQEGAEVALDGLHIHAFADVATAAELPLHRGEHHALARIAGRVDVGDVVAGSLQGDLVGLQSPGADIEDAHSLSLARLRLHLRAAQMQGGVDGAAQFGCVLGVGGVAGFLQAGGKGCDGLGLLACLGIARAV